MGLACPTRARPKRNFWFDVNKRFESTRCVTLYNPSALYHQPNNATERLTPLGGSINRASLFSSSSSSSPVLSEPELEPEGVDAVEVVAEEPLVPHEAQVLVQPQRRTVRYLRL